jgi:hypothetical protein
MNYILFSEMTVLIEGLSVVVNFFTDALKVLMRLMNTFNWCNRGFCREIQKNNTQADIPNRFIRFSVYSMTASVPANARMPKTSLCFTH